MISLHARRVSFLIIQTMCENAIIWSVFKCSLARSCCNQLCCVAFVSQPRRISAVSIAERVAHERCENLGLTCGYSVRFESAFPRPYSGLLYCTVGMLIRLLRPASVTTLSSYLFFHCSWLCYQGFMCHLSLLVCLRGLCENASHTRCLLTAVNNRVTTCLENLEMSGILNLSGKCQGVNFVMEKGTKTGCC